jgi:hypothetical protein
MRRLRILASSALLLLIALAVWTTCFRRNPARSSPREIANALLQLHNDWETNGYRSPGTGVPRTLGSSSVQSAGPYFAYVEYQHRLLGVRWDRRYHILRANTNGAVWTLYDIRWSEWPSVPWLHRKRAMITVTNAQ